MSNDLNTQPDAFATLLRRLREGVPSVYEYPLTTKERWAIERREAEEAARSAAPPVHRPECRPPHNTFCVCW